MKTSPLLALGWLFATVTVAAPAVAGDQVASVVTTPSAKAEAGVDCSKNVAQFFSIVPPEYKSGDPSPLDQSQQPLIATF